MLLQLLLHHPHVDSTDGLKTWMYLYLGHFLAFQDCVSLSLHKSSCGGYESPQETALLDFRTHALGHIDMCQTLEQRFITLVILRITGPYKQQLWWS